MSESPTVPGNRAQNLVGTVIHGTMQPRDLVPALADLLAQLDSPDNDIVRLARALPPVAFESDAAPFVNLVEYTLADLFDQLDALAPAGYYFGAHQGDGSDFGFWQLEDVPYPSTDQIADAVMSDGSAEPPL